MRHENEALYTFKNASKSFELSNNQSTMFVDFIGVERKSLLEVMLLTFAGVYKMETVLVNGERESVIISAGVGE